MTHDDDLPSRAVPQEAGAQRHHERLDLALLSVNNEQERANTAEFALMHEKEERNLIGGSSSETAIHEFDGDQVGLLLSACFKTLFGGSSPPCSNAVAPTLSIPHSSIALTVRHTGADI